MQKWEAGVREPRPRVKLKIIEMAPADLRAQLGVHHTLQGKSTGLVERIEALERAVAEHGKILRSLQQQARRRAG